MKDSIPQFSHLVTEIKQKHSDLAYIHVVEPRVNGINDVEVVSDSESNDFIREIWKPRPIISAGYRYAEEGLEVAEQNGDIFALGGYFISNVSVVSECHDQSTS